MHTTLSYVNNAILLPLHYLQYITILYKSLHSKKMATAPARQGPNPEGSSRRGVGPATPGIPAAPVASPQATKSPRVGPEILKNSKNLFVTTSTTKNFTEKSKEFLTCPGELIENKRDIGRGKRLWLNKMEVAATRGGTSVGVLPGVGGSRGRKLAYCVVQKHG